VCVFQVVLYKAAGLKHLEMVGQKAIATLLQQDPTPTFDYYVSDANVAPMDVSSFFWDICVLFLRAALLQHHTSATFIFPAPMFRRCLFSCFPLFLSPYNTLQYTATTTIFHTHFLLPCFRRQCCANECLYNTPPNTATHRNTPQHTATHRNTVQQKPIPTFDYCDSNANVVQIDVSATHCNTLQHTATLYNNIPYPLLTTVFSTPTLRKWMSLQHSATHCNTLQHSATL